MNERRPAPGSAWALHCPDAWPREWLDSSGTLPPGFTRPAEPLEADLITGRITESIFKRIGTRDIFQFVSGFGSANVTVRSRKQKRNPVVAKLLGYRRFLDALPDLDQRLSPGAVSVWCWLWTCERNGTARCSVRRLAHRFRVASSTATRWLTELRAARLVRVVRRGIAGQSASVVQIRTRVPPAERWRSANGA
jgi:hypothetical protein